VLREDAAMRDLVLPQTKPGKWSVGVTIAFFILVWMKIQDVMPVPAFAVFTLGAAGFGLEFFAILRRRDVSLLGVLPLLAGLLVCFWIAILLMDPH